MKHLEEMMAFVLLFSTKLTPNPDFVRTVSSLVWNHCCKTVLLRNHSFSPSLPSQLEAALPWQVHARPLPASRSRRRFASSSPFPWCVQWSSQEGLSGEDQHLLPKAADCWQQSRPWRDCTSLLQTPAEPGRHLLSRRKGSGHSGWQWLAMGGRKREKYPPPFFFFFFFLRFLSAAQFNQATHVSPTLRGVISSALGLWIANITFSCTAETVFLLLHQNEHRDQSHCFSDRLLKDIVIHRTWRKKLEVKTSGTRFSVRSLSKLLQSTPVKIYIPLRTSQAIKEDSRF